MNESITNQALADPRTCFAAERTFLAWVRTGVSLTALGFAIARFGLFLRQVAQVEQAASPHHSSFSLAVGIALIGAGVATTLFSLFRYHGEMKCLLAGKPIVPSLTRATVMSSFLIAVGVAMALYLLSVGR